MIYADRHICRVCGYRFEDHAQATNPDCPAHRCPGEKFPDFSAGEVFDKRTGKTKRTKAAEIELTENLRAYWNERKTTFLPK